MELELGLALPDPGGPKASGELGVPFGGKRGFGETFGARKATLPLFFVRGNDGDGGDEHRGGGDDDCERTNSRRKRLVGWPPVKCAHRRGSSGYVKVKMEGVAIGRKVDVSLHGCYDELRRTLDRMFPSSANRSVADAGTEDDDVAGRRDLQGQRRHPYVVTYEDGEGDWLLIGDVPWEAFAKSVKRLKILA